MKLPEIRTPRLHIFALSEDEFSALLGGSTSPLTRGYRYDGEPLTGHLKEVLARQLHKLQSAPQDTQYSTLWLIAEPQSGQAVGSFAFRGPPKDGVLEIGYGMGAGHRRQGYTTEAVLASTAWALGQPGVKEVQAETEPDNLPSQRVLEKSGYRQSLKAQTANSAPVPAPTSRRYAASKE